MSAFEKAFERTMGHEGGYAFDPNDSGGETWCGVARNHNPDWRGWDIIDDARMHADFPRILRTFPELADAVREVYRRKYWDVFDGDRVPADSIAMELFDTGVNMHPRVAVRFLQQSLNALSSEGTLWMAITPDGKMGAATHSALKDCLMRAMELPLLKKMNEFQRERYLAIVKNNPSQAKFLKGWLRRTGIEA